MKKVLLALSCVALFGLSSCNKEVDCECQGYVNGDAFGEPDTRTSEDGDCSEFEGEESMGGQTAEVKCEEV